MLNERAVELGRLIGQSPEYQAVKRASDALTQDADTVQVLKKMESLRADAQALINAGSHPPPAMEEELDRLLSQVQANPTYQRVLVANENFDKIMLQVNQWILEGIKKGSASPIITLG